MLIDAQLASYFQGAHFEPWGLPATERRRTAGSGLWRRTGSRNMSRTLTLINGCPRRGCQGATTLNAAFAAGRNASAVASLRVSTNTDAEIAAILASPAAAAEARRRLGDMVSLDNLAGCLLRYVLAPSARLARLEATLPHLPPLSAHGLRLGVAAHIRLGDSMFMPSASVLTAGAGSASMPRPKGAARRLLSRWQWADELQGLAYRRDPALAMRCLMHASGSVVSAGCLGCAVISDAQHAERCATQLLDAPLLTPGFATHPLASPADVARSNRSIEKVVLDWWVLARSHAALLFSGNGPLGQRASTLAGTAVQFRNASAAPSAVATLELVDGSLARHWREHCTLRLKL